METRRLLKAVLYSVKEGADTSALSPQMNDALCRCALLWTAFFGDSDLNGMTITSGHEGHDGDGVHGKGSLHYSRNAIDIRVKDVPIGVVVDRVVPALKLLLPPTYDVVFEGKHIHIEYDPT